MKQPAIGSYALLDVMERDIDAYNSQYTTVERPVHGNQISLYQQHTTHSKVSPSQ